MVTVAANTGNRDKIHETKEKLKEQIDELEGLLKNAKEKYAQLEIELAICDAKARPTYINGLPTELLSMVFRFFLCDNERHIRRLLLVCKRWYHLAISSPHLWASIRIEIPDKCLDVPLWADYIRGFASSCVERSHPNLLDISLELSADLCQGYDILLARLRSALEADYNVDAWLESWNGQEFNLIDYEFEIISFEQEILDLLADLTGPSGDLMVRWRSLEVFFPYDCQFAWQIWEAINYPTPNLTSLCLSGLQHLDNIDTLPTTLPDLSRLQTFYIEDVVHWEFLSLAPCSLQHIRVKTHIENRPSLHLSRFCNLKSLEILCEDVTWSELPSDAGPTRITLPRLQDLTLVAPFEHLTRSKFILPALRCLVIVCSYKESPNQLPRFQPNFVQWKLKHKKRLPGRREVPQVAPILRDFLCHFTTAKHLAVPASQKMVLLALLTNMSAEGLLPHTWEVVSFHDEEGFAETVVIHEFLGTSTRRRAL